MTHLHTSHFKTFDGKKLFYRWYSAGPKSDTFIIVHGHGEHSGRYEKFIPQLQGENISLAAFDLRGHGKSEGYDSYVESFEEYLLDVSKFIEHLKETHQAGGRLFLFGNSLGGLIATHWCLKNPNTVQALFLISPCLGLTLNGFLVRMNRMFNQWIPKFHYRNPIYPPYLTHNAKEREKYVADKLIRRKISVRLLDEMLKYIDKIDLTKPIELTCPLFILMSGLERVVDMNRTKLFYEHVRAPMKEIEVFDGFYHEIFNESGQQQAFDSLKSCLKRIP